MMNDARSTTAFEGGAHKHGNATLNELRETSGGGVMNTVVHLTEAIWRRVAALETEVTECLRAISQAPPCSWRRKRYIAELIEAERRLSVAEGMRNDERA